MNRQDVLNRLSGQGPIIAPSMLKCDFGRLIAEADALKSAGAKLLHWDVMDGHFVPNLSYGAPIIAAVRGASDLIFDAHLMIQEPARYIQDFLKAGCDSLTIHYEADGDPAEILSEIRAANRVAGLAINPGTPVDAITHLLPACDMILVMSVEPGFGGQKFMPQALEKLQALKTQIPAGTLLSVDGGIGPDTIAQTAKAGANVFVVGSAIFEADDYATAIENLTVRAAASA